MSIVARIFYFLSLFGLMIPLVVPNFERGMSWTEATPAVLIGLFFCALWALLSAIFPFGKDPYAKGQSRRRWMIALGAIGLGYCLVFGSGVAIACQKSIDKADRASIYSSYGGYGSSYGSGYGSSYGRYRSSYDSLRESYRDQDRHGRDLGIVVAGSSILPLVFLIIGLVLKPKAQHAAMPFASFPPAYGAGPVSSWPPAPGPQPQYAGPPSGQPGWNGYYGPQSSG
jgi:hypothetical protein